MRSDTRMVAELFDQAAKRLRDRITDDDLSAASEAVNMLVQIPQQCRCDLFAERPRRAMEWRARETETTDRKARIADAPERHAV